MKPRVTVSIDEEGILEIWINEAGRDALLKALSDLDERNDHFHLTTDLTWGDITLSDIPYRSSDSLIDTAKVMFRPDKWDLKYFPHVFSRPD